MVKKELPLVAFFYQQKIVAISKSFPLLSGLSKKQVENLKLDPRLKAELAKQTKLNLRQKIRQIDIL
ncbi:hypothetical protein HYN56_08915 [Flavobacterium crocinum]|uniref:Uncharacterized protein n=1 Tax=Flavobacterium crocinum TaxID=2183896 RepID=A0A2S1YJU5_9FLAO|nr:hypothetical protein HYN56_08915 [Flavobacterium crocinum]